jgi:3-oxoacyl-[acyl-carrier protein] reductase
MDVTSQSSIDAGFASAIRAMGQLDILINNAAIDSPPGSNASFFGNFDEIMAVNISGAVNMCKAVIPGMIENGGGVIVNIGSIQGNIGADYRNYE